MSVRRGHAVEAWRDELMQVKRRQITVLKFTGKECRRAGCAKTEPAWLLPQGLKPWTLQETDLQRDRDFHNTRSI